MKPVIEDTAFGSITVAGETYEYDVFIRLDGQVKKRKKKLSKEIYGTSHLVSQAEAAELYDKGAVKIIVGSGQSGMLSLSDEARTFFDRKLCQVVLLPTPQAIVAWNSAAGPVIGMFHVTC